MSGAWIKKRTTSKGESRYVVYYRRGGRAFQQVYAGSFKTKRDAETRRTIVAGKLAAGEDPAAWLASLKVAPVKPVRSELLEAYLAFEASRQDVADATRDAYRNSREKIVPLLGTTTDPQTITVEQVQALINTLHGEPHKMAVKSIRAYVGTLRQVLDYVDVTPNPVKSTKVKYPRFAEEEKNPPSTAEWRATFERIPKTYRLFARVLECGGMRIGEGLELRWGDIDWNNSRFRISKARTKTSSGQRWLPMPAVLLDEIAGLIPEEDRVMAGRVFVGFGESGFRNALARAVKTAGVTHYSPHDLRHRRISLWFAHGIDEIRVAAWSGHANPSMSQDVYGHVLIDASEDEWRQFWLAQYRGTGVAQVGHQEVDA